MNEVTLTQDETLALYDHLDYSIFDNIRSDEDVDNMMWLCNMCEIYKKCKAVFDVVQEKRTKEICDMFKKDGE